MSFPKPGFSILGSAIAIALMTSCAPPEPEGGSESASAASSALTAQERLAACNQDPRVIAGLVSAEVCAGADIFFRETFDGNGRKCGSCHPVENNYTIDVPFITALGEDDPLDPLFVAEYDPNLAELETDELRTLGVIRENVDGFEDLDNKFTVRAVSHIFSMAATIDPDPADGTAVPPVHRTGWSGDGAPGDGSLRSFLTGAINQHFPKDLSRQPGVSFRLPTEEELDLTLAFQMSVGRTNELDLQQVNLFDPLANDGRQAFLDPQRGRCNVCHENAGARHQDSGLNRNLDTGTRGATVSNTLGVFDGGFGGKGLAAPNIDVLGLGFPNGYGDGTFNTPSLIESVDTPPFFHHNAFGLDIEGAMSFYTFPVFFPVSPAGQELEARFGTPIAFTGDDITKMGRFLRVLNAAFNLDIAKQRLLASQTLVNQFHDTRADVQLRLMELAEVEIDDALEVLTTLPDPSVQLHPISQGHLQLAKGEIAAGLTASTWSQRQNRISNAISRVTSARDQFGANINFQLGQGTLMY
ncbi:hypothetical protein WME89_41515 [Sorangium sp. So ce321]|uniref:hypothetical protein n=1 Tax=Sorangium sp. So ce321 TaxID=3133300 RepID=UPI003F635817